MSIDSLKAAGSTLKNLQVAIDVVANNIANINTQGFKEKSASFEEIVSQMGGETALSGSVVSAITTNFRQGSLRATGSIMDLALSGKGFFTVQNAGGDVSYTRSGTFGFDADHNLVDQSGNYVLGMGSSRITVPNDATQIQINAAGEVMVKRGNTVDSEFEVLEQLQLANFSNPAGLNNIGQNLYKESVNSGQVEFGTALEAGTSLAATNVVAGSLESSNVDMSSSLVNLIALQRSYQALSKAADAENQLTETTISLAS